MPVLVVVAVSCGLHVPLKVWCKSVLMEHRGTWGAGCPPCTSSTSCIHIETAQPCSPKILLYTSLCPAHSNQDAWTALVRTQDLTPPVLTIVDAPPPDFDSFFVVAHLDEPGTLYAALLLSSQTAQVTGSAACPPVLQVGRTRAVCTYYSAGTSHKWCSPC